MQVCPKDLKPCMDDICRSGCLQCPGEDMIDIHKCFTCGNQTSDDPDFDDCTCITEYPED